MNGYKYFAFISYSWKDKRAAKWIQRKLESFSIPISLRKDKPDLPSHIRPVFRDASDLEIGILSESIESALRASKYLIVLCSPDSARSRWVDQEIRYFSSLEEEAGESRYARIIPVIVAKPLRGGGEKSDVDFSVCFPGFLKSLSAGKEILAANVFETGWKYAFVKVVSRMLGIEPDLLWQRNRRQRKKSLFWACVLGLSVSALVFTGYRVLKTQVRDLQAQKVIEKARNLIDTEDPITAERLLLRIIPDRLPKKHDANLSKALFLLREAEHAYQHESRILPGTKDFEYWNFLDERRIGSSRGISDIVNGKYIRFPNEFGSGGFGSYAFSDSGSVAFYTDRYSVLRYDVDSDRLSLLCETLGERFIYTITTTQDHRLGIVFDHSIFDVFRDRDTLGCIVNSENGNLLAVFEGSFLDEKGNYDSNDLLYIDEAQHRAYLGKSADGRTQAYDADSGAYLGKCDLLFNDIVRDAAVRDGFVSPEVPFDADWIRDRGIVVTPSVSSTESRKRSYFRQGDSLFVSDADGNRLLSAFCPYPLQENCTELLAREGDPLARRTILFSPDDQYYSDNLYALDWIERRVVKIDTPDFFGGECLEGWSKEGNALILSMEIEPGSAEVFIVPVSPSAFSLRSGIDYWKYYEWPVSPDASTVLVDDSLYNIDSGELVATIDTPFLSYLFCPGNLFVFISEEGLTGLDTTDGSIRFLFPDYHGSGLRHDEAGGIESSSGRGYIKQMTHDERFLGFNHDQAYVVISLPDGREVLRDPEGSRHLLTDDTLFSYSDHALSAWSLTTGKQMRFEECPSSGNDVLSGLKADNIGITPDHDFVLLEIGSESYVYDARSGCLAAVCHRMEDSGHSFKSIDDDYPSERLLSALRERYGDNAMTKKELEQLLSE